MNQPRPPAGGTGLAFVYSRSLVLLAVLLLLSLALAGCDDEDCVSCLQMLPPVVPTGVHSVSADNAVIIQWFEISYAPYDGTYNQNVESYYIYRRDYIEGQPLEPDRIFYRIGEVAWDENYDPYTGVHWFIDDQAYNGYQYEYAVSAVNAAGESALSYELIIDAPLPMSPPNTYVELHDYLGLYPELGGFDFSRAAANPGIINAGVVDPTVIATTADIRIEFEGAVPFVETTSPNIRIQDAGNPLGPEWLFWFERVGWAPADGYSNTGRLELVLDHIYVVEIWDPLASTLHYAKFGVIGVAPSQYVHIVWAYQLISGLPELKSVRQPNEQAAEQEVLRL